jgi:DNA repair photolyase
MPVALFRGEEWGTWVEVKDGAVEVLRRDLTRVRKKGPVKIFLSSATDPYQPEEARAGLTRSLLEVLSEQPPDFLFLQTRSPLVTRDVDILLKLKDRLLVSVTVETDLEEVRRAFAPAAPPVPARLRALGKLKEAGLFVQAAVSPVLPFSREFPAKLHGLVDRVCLDDFFLGDGSGGRRTERLHVRKIHEGLGLERWYGPDVLKQALAEFRKVFPAEKLLVSRDGFLPPGGSS